MLEELNNQPLHMPHGATHVLRLLPIPAGPHRPPAASRPLEGERQALTTLTDRDVKQAPSTTPDKLQEEPERG